MFIFEHCMSSLGNSQMLLSNLSLTKDLFFCILTLTDQASVFTILCKFLIDWIHCRIVCVNTSRILTMLIILGCSNNSGYSTPLMTDYIDFLLVTLTLYFRCLYLRNYSTRCWWGILDSVFTNLWWRLQIEKRMKRKMRRKTSLTKIARRKKKSDPTARYRLSL